MELERSIDALDLLCRTRRVFVLTGAGLSTNSGIPDYRGEGARLRKRPPMTIKEFRSGDDAQRRYWARSYMGWPSFAAARPNAGHQAVARLGAAGAVHALVTQNVDRLHHRAGSRDAVELHGALEDVLCLSCGAREHRDALQLRLAALNPEVVLGAPSLGALEVRAEGGRRAEGAKAALDAILALAGLRSEAPWSGWR